MYTWKPLRNLTTPHFQLLTDKVHFFIFYATSKSELIRLNELSIFLKTNHYTILRVYYEYIESNNERDYFAGNAFGRSQDQQKLPTLKFLYKDTTITEI